MRNPHSTPTREGSPQTRLHPTPLLLILAVVTSLLGLTAPPVTAAAATNPVTVQATPITTTSACQDVVFIGARGSGAPWKPTDPNDQGMGQQIHSTYHDFLQELRLHAVSPIRAAYYALPSPDYPAAGTETLFSGLQPNEHTVYFKSIDAGVTATINLIDARTTRCPNERYVLAGHSQGAMVMHRAIEALLTNSPSTVADKNKGDRILSKVSAVVAVADGDRTKGDQVARFGTGANLVYNGIARVTDGNPWYTAIAAATYGHNSELDRSNRWDTSRYMDLCSTNDPICDFQDILIHAPLNQGALGYLVRTMQDGFKKIHSAYAGTVPLNQASAEAADRVLVDLTPRLAITGNPPPAVIGTPYSYAMTATGNRGAAVTWSATGLPPGLSIGAATGVIAGTPTSSGRYAARVSATAIGSVPSSMVVSLTVNNNAVGGTLSCSMTVYGSTVNIGGWSLQLTTSFPSSVHPGQTVAASSVKGTFTPSAIYVNTLRALAAQRLLAGTWSVEVVGPSGHLTVPLTSDSVAVPATGKIAIPLSGAWLTTKAPPTPGTYALTIGSMTSTVVPAFDGSGYPPMPTTCQASGQGITLATFTVR